MVLFRLGGVGPGEAMNVEWVRTEEKAAGSRSYVFDFGFLAWVLSFFDSCILQLGPWIWRIME